MKAIHMKYRPKPRKPEEKKQKLNSSDSDEDSKVVEAEAYSKGKITPEIAEMLSKLK